MPVASLNSVRFSIGDRVLLDGVSLAVEPDDRIGIVGRNGAGKSTLLKILAGIVRPDEGDVQRAKGGRVSYVAQEPVLEDAGTLREEAEHGLADVNALHAELDELYEKLSSATGDELDTLLREQSRLQTRLEHAGGYAVGHRVEAVLHGLGFSDDDFALPVHGLSGGQRSRVALAKALLNEPDLLLLDEPTNHLDIEGRRWLEVFLRDEFPGAVVLISHDRVLLDRVVTRIVEIERGRLVDYPGNYAAFRKIRAERVLTQQRAWEKHQDRVSKERAFIDKYRAGQRAKQARGRETRLERELDETSIERPMELAVMSIDIPRAPRTGDIVASVVGAEVTHRNDQAEASRTLFCGLDWKISRGDRWGIIGPNGCGKSTLVRCIVGEQALNQGSVRLGSNIVLGHFKQVDESIDGSLTVREHLQREYRREHAGALLSDQAARDLAGAFLFTGHEQDKPLHALSGGELMRVRLASMLVAGKNLLVLDEPTNHLDIPSCERLEQALRSTDDGGCFDHTLLLISHDRALLQALCDRLVVFDGRGGVRVFLGRYEDLERSISAGSAGSEARDGDRSKPVKRAERGGSWGSPPGAGGGVAGASASGPSALPHTSTTSDGVPKQRRSNPLSWMNQAQLEERIEELSSAVRRIDERLADPKVYSSVQETQRCLSERAEAQRRLAEHEDEWLRRADGA